MIYNLKDDPGCCSMRYDWIVTYYTRVPYEGNGEAIAKLGDKLYYWNLGHCSCYGPFDDNPEEIDISDITSNNIHNSPISNSAVENKVRELLCL